MLPLIPSLPTTPRVLAKVPAQVAKEKAAEEVEIRKEYEEQLTTLETEARTAFKAEVEAKLSVARSKFETELAAGKAVSQAEHEAELGRIETSEAAKFRARVAAQKASLKQSYLARVQRTRKAFQKAVGAAEAKAKREYAMREREQLPPRLLRQYRRTEMQIFKEAVAAEKEVYEEEAEAWEQRAIGKFETGLETWKKGETEEYAAAITAWETAERERLEVELVEAETTAKAGFQLQITEWKKKEKVEKLEPAMEEWKIAWQPKSISERLLDVDIKLPSLNVALFKVPKEGGLVQVGFDVGKFFEGMAEGYKAAGAGIIASAESFVYGLASLAGVPTPRKPPTLVGGLITTGIVSIRERKLKPSPQLEELGKKPFAITYAASTLLGDILLAKGLGMVTQKVIVEPLSKTRLGQYVGYQFKVHAPKPLLRVVYGKKAAQYIYQERLPYTVGTTRFVTPSGEVITQTYRVPKAVELTGKAYLKEIFTGTGAEAAGFPLKVTRGARITPMKTTLSKAITAGLKERKAVTTLLAPLQTVEKVIRPELPELATALQFGVVPITETVPTIAGLGTILGVKVAARVKAAAVAKPAIRPVVRIRVKERAALIPIIGEITGLGIAEVPAELQVPAQVQAPVQATIALQIQQLQLQLLPPRPKKEKKRKLERKPPLEKDVWKVAAGLAEYPIMPTKEVPSYIFSGLPKQTTTRKPQDMDISNVILGRRKRR